MKIHWGHKLVFFAVSFMLFILGMVYYISRQSVELVADDYYEKGINYQTELDKFSARENRDFTFQYVAGKQQVLVHLNGANNLGAKLTFYRASDSKQDFKNELMTDTSGNIEVSVASMQIGLWKVTCEWSLAGKSVAFSKEFYVQ